MENTEEKITSLLQLRSKLEQEIRANIIKIKDLNKQIEKRRKWIHYLDGVLSESSFQPASSLLEDNFVLEDAQFDIKESEKLEKLEENEGTVVDLSGIINIRQDSTDRLLATVNILEANIIITFSKDILIDVNNKYFNDFFKEKILSLFEKAGGKIFIERGEQGNVISISIIGEFDLDLREKCVKSLRYTLDKIAQ
ncbi:MAG: hypothetical protein ACTSUE_10250 [Promethearchaeota archaeon]